MRQAFFFEFFGGYVAMYSLNDLLVLFFFETNVTPLAQRERMQRRAHGIVAHFIYQYCI